MNIEEMYEQNLTEEKQKDCVHEFERETDYQRIVCKLCGKKLTDENRTYWDMLRDIGKLHKEYDKKRTRGILTGISEVIKEGILKSAASDELFEKKNFLYDGLKVLASDNSKPYGTEWPFKEDE